MGEKKLKFKRFCIFIVKVVAIVIVLDLLYSFAQNGRYEMTQTEHRTIVFDKWDKKFIIKRNNDYSPDVYEVKEDNIFDEIF